MKQLVNLRFFLLLRKGAKNKFVLTQLEDAYEEFATRLLEKLHSETDITKLYYHLGFVKLEFAGIKDNLSDGQEKKCLNVCC